jgi:hypothetical protein
MCCTPSTGRCNVPMPQVLVFRSGLAHGEFRSAADGPGTKANRSHCSPSHWASHSHWPADEHTPLSAQSRLPVHAAAIVRLQAASSNSGGSSTAAAAAAATICEQPRAALLDTCLVCAGRHCCLRGN